MVGRYRGFSSLLREKNNLFIVHNVLYRQHLVAKRLGPRVQESLGVAVKVSNKIKANAKTTDYFESCARQAIKNSSLSFPIQKFVGCQKGSLWQDIENFKIV